MLALVAIFVCANATSLYLAQKRLDALADAAALAGADGFTITMAGGEPHAELRDAAVFTQASEIVDAVGQGAALVSAGTPDGLSARVTVATVWHAPIVSLFVPDGRAARRHGDEPHGAALTGAAGGGGRHGIPLATCLDRRLKESALRRSANRPMVA